MASLTYWYVPVHWLMLDQFRSLELIGTVKTPLLILHGTDDRIILFALGERLYAAAPEPKRFVRIEGGGHSRNLEQGGMAAVEAFLAAIEAQPSDHSTMVLSRQRTLSRAFAVLSAVRGGCSDLASIGRAAEISKSTTHRLVVFLQRNGFLRHVEGRGYFLGPKLIELGAAALEQMPLTSLARPHIERLAQQTGDTIHLSIRDEDVIVYVDKIPGNKGLEMRSRVGLRKAIATTGTGKALMLDLPEEEWARLYSLAHSEVISAEVPPPGFLPWEKYRQAMREYQSKGYTIELEENEAGIRCVAAPIRDARGSIVAGLSVASTIPYMSKERMQALAPAVVACARSISSELGFTSSKQPDRLAAAR